MSGEVSRLYILFDADGKPYVKGLRGLEQQTHQSASTMEKRFGAAGKTIAGAMGLSVAAIAAGIVGIGVATVKSAASFEYEMSRVQAVSNATGAEMQQLSDLALQLGKDTVFSSGQAAQGLYSLATAGVSVADIMGGAGQAALALAAAGEIEVGRAAEIAAAAMNVFKLQGKDVMSVADALAAGATKSAVEVTDLADAFQMSASVAAQAGWTVQELTAALSEMGNAGLRGSDAGTSLKQMLMQLQVPSEKAAKAMKELGINVYDANGNMYDAETVIGILEQAFEPLNQQQRDYNAGVIFGTDAIRAANVLIGQGAKAFDTMRDSVSQAGEANRVATAKMDNLRGSWEQLKGSVETLAISIGTKALPKIREFVDELTAMVNDVLDTGDWTQLGERLGELIGDGIQTATPYIIEAMKTAAVAGAKAIPTAIAGAIVGAPTGSDFSKMRDYLAKQMAGAYKDLPKSKAFQSALADLQAYWSTSLFEGRSMWVPKVKTADDVLALGRALGVVFTDAELQNMVKLGLDPDKLAQYTAEQLTAAQDALRRQLSGNALPTGGLWQPGADPGAGLRGFTSDSQQAADAQDNLGLSVAKTTEELQAEKDALEAAQAILDGYAASLQGIADSTLDPASIWKEADGSLKKYLKSLKTHQQDWATFQASLKTIAKDYGAGMGDQGGSILQKFIELGPEELAKLKKAGPKAIEAFIGGAKTQLAIDSPAFIQELLGLTAPDYSWVGAGIGAAGSFTSGWGKPEVPVKVKPINLDSTWEGIRAYFADRHITIDTNLGGYSHASGYDAGGYIQPGINVVANYTGKPEPVLTSGQWDAVQSLIAGVVKPSMDTSGPASDQGMVTEIKRLQAVTAGLAAAFERAASRAEQVRLDHDRQRVMR